MVVSIEMNVNKSEMRRKDIDELTPIVIDGEGVLCVLDLMVPPTRNKHRLTTSLNYLT